MARLICPLLVFAMLFGCGSPSEEAHTEPQTPPPPPTTEPASLLSQEPPPPPPPLPAPRILSGVELRMPRKNPKKSQPELMREMDIQIFFPKGVPRPSAGEYADVVGPKGYRFLARVAYVREAIEFQSVPFKPIGLGYYARLVPIDHFGEDFDPKAEKAIALIPSVPERRTRAKAAPNPPDLASLPIEAKNLKLFSYADTDGDGEVDAVAATSQGDCRYGLFKEENTWLLKRSFCGKNPK